MSASLRLLILEDSENDALLVVRQLERAGFQLEFERVETAEALEDALARREWDLILSDYSIPRIDGRAALALYQKKGLDIPFISVSGVMSEDIAVEMMKAGAHDYVMKSNLARLAPAVTRELRAAQERRERRQIESARAHLAALVESCDDAIIGANPDGTVVSWNEGAERLFGYRASEMAGQPLSALVPSQGMQEMFSDYELVQQGGRLARFETVRLCKNGQLVQVSVTISPIKDALGLVTGTSIVARDITQRKREEQERLSLIQELTQSLARVKTLNGLLPICSACKKIRDDQGYWRQVEIYIKDHSNADFTHSICPECAGRLYPEYIGALKSKRAA
jgi:two-component system, cell cycle sensor histidine kinase and response regulator CckA